MHLTLWGNDEMIDNYPVWYRENDNDQKSDNESSIDSKDFNGFLTLDDYY